MDTRLIATFATLRRQELQTYRHGASAVDRLDRMLDRVAERCIGTRCTAPACHCERLYRMRD